MRRLRSVWDFAYDFVVGDDWRGAAVIVAALIATALLVHVAHLNAWWLLPVCVFAALGWSLRRATAARSLPGPTAARRSAGRCAAPPRPAPYRGQRRHIWRVSRNDPWCRILR